MGAKVALQGWQGQMEAEAALQGWQGMIVGQGRGLSWMLKAWWQSVKRHSRGRAGRGQGVQTQCMAVTHSWQWV